MSNLLEHFASHHDQLLYAIAGICLLVELGVLGMSGPLLFIALSCVLTGVLVSLGLLQGWPLELLMVGVLSVLSAAVLWKPLKKFQNAKSDPDTSSDMIGRRLTVTLEITHKQGRVAYSGIEWQARLAESITEPITVTQTAEVIGVDGSLLLVKNVAAS